MKQICENEPLSSLTHLIAALLSIAALVVMIVFSSQYGTAAHIVGVTIFGSSLIALYLASTLYHIFPRGTRTKYILRRIDHAMIFVLIAGTYTPIALAIPQRGWGWSIFGVIWGIALIGIVIKCLGLKMTGWLSVVIYIAMGWLALIAINPLMQWLTFHALKWLFIGGLFYTIGCIFFGLDKLLPRKRWFGMHEVFHLFVIAGSASHFWLMIKYVL
ncbi:MAG: hemolysin III family protein [Candidatus Komeilibacteria bacterium]